MRFTCRSSKCLCVSLSQMIGMGTNGADLGVTFRVHPLAGHCHQPAVDENPFVMPEMDSLLRERTGSCKARERHHFRHMRQRERNSRRTARSRIRRTAVKHLIARYRRQKLPRTGYLHVFVTDEYHIVIEGNGIMQCSQPFQRRALLPPRMAKLPAGNMPNLPARFRAHGCAYAMRARPGCRGFVSFQMVNAQADVYRPSVSSVNNGVTCFVTFLV